MCDGLKEGDTLWVGAVNNHFSLSDKARSFLLVAGGIGITPLLSMIRSLAARRMQGENTPPWRLYYFTRDAEHTAFADLLRGPLSDPALGGKVLMPAMAVPGIGRTAVVLDDQGAALGLFEPAAS